MVDRVRGLLGPLLVMLPNGFRRGQTNANRSNGSGQIGLRVNFIITFVWPCFTYFSNWIKPDQTATWVKRPYSIFQILLVLWKIPDSHVDVYDAIVYDVCS